MDKRGAFTQLHRPPVARLDWNDIVRKISW
jgi:hypothetical protein